METKKFQVQNCQEAFLMAPDKLEQRAIVHNITANSHPSKRAAPLRLNLVQ